MQLFHCHFVLNGGGKQENGKYMFGLAEVWTASKDANHGPFAIQHDGFERGPIKRFLAEITAFLKVTGKLTQDNDFFYYICSRIACIWSLLFSEPHELRKSVPRVFFSPWIL